MHFEAKSESLVLLLFLPHLNPHGPTLNLPHALCNNMHNTTGDISSSCLLFLPLFCPREAERKIEANQTEQAKEKRNRRKHRRTNEKAERGGITSLHPCSCVLAQSLAFPLAGREWCEKPMAEQGNASPGVMYHCKPCLCLLRAGKQFSDKENHFSSWGQSKHSGAYFEPSPMTPEPRCPSAVLCLLLQLWCSCTQVSEEFQSFRKRSSDVQEVFYSSDPNKCQPPQLRSQYLLCISTQLRPRRFPAASSSASHLPSLLQMLCSWP